MSEREPVVTVTRHRSHVKLRWRTRLRIWNMRRKQTPMQRALLREIDAKFDRLIFFGEEKP